VDPQEVDVGDPIDLSKRLYGTAIAVPAAGAPLVK
jgi:hypothetical protein